MGYSNEEGVRDMERETRTALAKTVRRWRRVARQSDGEVVVAGPRECALCGLFSDFVNWRVNAEDRCFGCPVRDATGQDSCQGTPYGSFVDAALAAGWRSNKSVRAAAVEMTKFLEGLRPELHVVVGKVTDPDVAAGWGVEVGAPEYRLVDDVERPGWSYDFPSEQEARDWADERGYRVSS